ncbi:MAG: T9SS type A sorting domain-containing protein [Mariniphaga sp.]
MKRLIAFLIAIAFLVGGFAQTKQIPMANLGIEADKKVDKQLPYMDGNAAVIECPLQAMRGNISTKGLVIKSLSKEEGVGDFILRPLSYSKGELNTVGNGLISIGTNAVLLNRGNLSERFTASSDGIRQDFILSKAPLGTQDLSVMLELKGAVAANSAQGVSIKMDNGRKLEYHNLYITDAAGKVLKGEMNAVSEGLIAINVNDANAVYPLTIDPTITDADWVALNTSIPGTSGVINAIAISGSDIYVGGDFIAAGSGLANYIAKWNGSDWSALGVGVSGTVYSLAISGTDLYVGGYFTTAGGITVNNIAKWNITTSTWSALGSGVNNDALAIGISGTDVYVGGKFTLAGGNSANRIAKWNGTEWSALGTGLNERVLCIAISGTDLYVGGRFTNAGGSTANRIAKWNGTAWSTFGSGRSDYVYALAISGSDVYVGGIFSDYLSKWNGSAWSTLGTGVIGGSVAALALSGSDLYVGGGFSTAGGITVNKLAKWDISTSTWSALGSGVDSNVTAIALSGSGDVYAGGYIVNAGSFGVCRIAKWNGTAWSALGSGSNGWVNAIAINGVDMYIGGAFTNIGNVPASKIAKWNGTVWSALGTGVELTNGRNVSAIAINGGDVYVGGGFTTVGGITVNNIAKWDGTAWSALGSGVDNSVLAIAISGSNVYAGGYFTTAGGALASRIAKWNGTAWSALGVGLDNGIANKYVNSIAVSGSDVYAAGSFATAGVSAASNIAKWNGTEWSALGAGLDNIVNAIAINRSNMYVGGYFTTAGGASANRIAKWDGTSWSALGSGTNSSVSALAMSESDVYVGGNFTTAGGVSANRIAKWDGNAWSVLGSGVNVAPNALAMSGTTELTVGGNFITAGDKFSPYLAKVINIADPTWTGVSSNNWSTAGNWSTNKVPAATNNAIVPSVGITNFPVVNEAPASPAVCKDLTIQTGATVTIAAGKALTVNGALTNNAGITGLVVQSTSDGATGTGFLLNGTVGVLGTLERWVSGDIWHLISPPATGGETIASFVDLANGNLVARNATNYALSSWLEGTGVWDYYKVSGSNTSDQFGTPAKGYQVMRTTGAGTGTGTGGGDGKLTFKGTLAAANKSIAVTKSLYGWNLIGNPYPCALDVALFLSTNTAVLDPSFQFIYVSKIADVTAYGYDPNTDGLKLAPGEGFFVRTKAGGGTVSFTTAMKSNVADAFKAATVDSPTIQLIVEDGNAKFSTTVEYEGGATKGLDPGKDAGLFNGTSSSFSLFSRLIEDNGVDFTIQALPDNNLESMVVPVGLVADKGASVTFSATVANLPVNYKVYLEDKEKGVFTRLDEVNSSYNVSLESATIGTGRFYLHTAELVSAIDESWLSKVKVVPMPELNLVRIIGNFDLPATAMVYDMNGKLVATSALTSQIENNISLPNCSTGVYLLRIESGNEPETMKFVWKRM